MCVKLLLNLLMSGRYRVTSALIIQWRDSESVTLCFKIRNEGIREEVLIFSCYNIIKDHICVLLMIWCCTVVACILRLCSKLNMKCIRHAFMLLENWIVGYYLFGKFICKFYEN